MKQALRVIHSELARGALCLALLAACESYSVTAEPFAEKVVEQQVEKAATKKKEDITDPALSEYTESIKALTPKWAQDLLLRYRNSFHRIADKEKLPLEQSPLTDEEKNTILSSLKSLQTPLYSAQINFTLLTSREKFALQSKAELTRVYLPDSEDPLSQQYREKITITEPESLDGYTWLTFRFFKETFDRVWIFNPKAKRARPVAPQLRSESLFYSAFSADDLFGFSGNLKKTDVTFGAPEVSLVPITQSVFETSMVGSCNVYSDKKESSENKSVPSSEALSPPQVDFQPRETIPLLLVHQDPFNNYGKILLVIDRASKLPIYKRVEARNGDELSVSVSALSIAENASDTQTTWMFGERGKTASLLRYHQYTLCKENQFQLEPSEFDPGKLTTSSSLR